MVAHRNEENQIEAISMVARDLSELKAAEQRVEASEIRLAALVEHASDLVCVADDAASVCNRIRVRARAVVDVLLAGQRMVFPVPVSSLYGSLLC